MNRKLFLSALRDTLPVMSGYLVLGAGYGILLSSMDLGAGWAFLTSLFIYAGSMQFALAGLLAAGASLMTVAMTTLLVNARHLFYGISMIERYRDTGRMKPYLIFGLTDETYSLVCRNPLPEWAGKEKLYYLTVTAMDQLYWVTGSVLGGLAGSLLPFSTEGISFSMTALFITIFTDQWLKTKNHAAAITGVGVTLLCRIAFGSASFLIPAMGVILLLLLNGYRRERKGEAHGE